MSILIQNNNYEGSITITELTDLSLVKNEEALIAEIVQTFKLLKKMIEIEQFMAALLKYIQLMHE